MYYILFYKADADYIEKRAPYRPEHLALATKYKEDGKIVMAGAFADPADGSAIVFKADTIAEVEEFAKNDPYVTNGVVKDWHIRQWTVVISA
jgi:uncharacterized protein YciI